MRDIKEMKVGFIGAGHMAQALADGMVKAGLISASQIDVADVSKAAVKKSATKGFTTHSSNTEVVQACDVIFFAVRPVDLRPVLAELAAANVSVGDKIFISICAGIPLSAFKESHYGATSPFDNAVVVRVLPNTPCLVGKGAAAYVMNEKATPEHKERLVAILGCTGLAIEVAESEMDTVTACSGSGPAFFYLFMDAMIDGAVKMGLPRPTATRLIAQTALGSAAMVLETGESPSTLKDQVATPGGTTIHGVTMMEEKGLRAAGIAGIEAAARRSTELGKKD